MLASELWGSLASAAPPQVRTISRTARAKQKSRWVCPWGSYLGLSRRACHGPLEDPGGPLEAPECRHVPLTYQPSQHLGVGWERQEGLPSEKQAVFLVSGLLSPETPGLSLQSALMEIKACVCILLSRACLPLPLSTRFSESFWAPSEEAVLLPLAGSYGAAQREVSLKASRLCTASVSAACFPGLLALACNSLIHLISPKSLCRVLVAGSNGSN